MSRVALITGGTRGIGLAMAKELRKAGMQVAVAARSEFPQISCDMYIRADLKSANERAHLVDAVFNKFGRFDILVNNAGEQVFRPAFEYTDTMFMWMYELMVAAPLDLSRQAAKYMLARDGGHIVNVLSTAAFQGAKNIVGYVAAKHALLGLTRALAVEWAPTIHVNAIAPGLTDTDMVRDMDHERRKLLESITPAGRFGKPEEVADALMYLVNSSYVYGQTIVVDGGWLCKNG